MTSRDKQSSFLAEQVPLALLSQEKDSMVQGVEATEQTNLPANP
jgi:hypothetical protein